MMRYLILFTLLFSGVAYAQQDEEARMPKTAAITIDQQKAACEAVFNLSKEGADFADYSIRKGWIDINNDGTEERLEYDKDDKAKVTAASGKDAPAITQDGEKAAFTLMPSQRWMRFGGQNFLLDFAVQAVNPKALWFVQPDFTALKLCDYETTQKVTASKPDLNAQKEFDVKKLCEAVAKQQGVEYVTVGEMSPITIDAAQKATGEVTVDLNKDGESDVLYAIDYQRKDGCRYRYFLPKADIHPDSAEDQPLSTLGNQLYWAQLSQPDDPDGKREPMDCVTAKDSRLITYGDETLLERGDLSEAPAGDQLYHQVWLFRSNEKYELCHFKVEAQTYFTLNPLPGTEE